jgi:hypothetical protein
VSARRVCLLALGVFAAALPRAGSAQGLRDRVLAWPQGDFRAPLVCVLDGSPRQALRRVRIHPAPRNALPSVRITFQDLEAPAGTACGGVSNQDEPNVIGALDLVFEGRNQPDTGEVDFRNALRRDGGFSFRIRAGRLRIGPAGEATASLQSFDYAGGTARVQGVAPGSDAARRLSVFGAERQLQLELDAEGARRLTFDLVELPPH